MKVLVCQVCSNRNFAKQGDMYVCQSCGTQYTLEDARKLLVDVPDAPAAPNYAQQNYAQPNYAQPNYAQPNNADEINRYRILARRAADAFDAKNACNYYEQLYKLAPNDWDAAFHSVYYRAFFGERTELGSDFDRVTNSLPGIMNIVGTYVPPAQRQGIVRYMAERIEHLASEGNRVINDYAIDHENSNEFCEAMRDSVRDTVKRMASYAEQYQEKDTAVHLLQSVVTSGDSKGNIELNNEIRRLDPAKAAENDKAIETAKKQIKATNLTGWGIVAIIFGVLGLFIGWLFNKIFDGGTVIIVIGVILTVLGIALAIVGKVKSAKAK